MFCEMKVKLPLFTLNHLLLQKMSVKICSTHETAQISFQSRNNDVVFGIIHTWFMVEHNPSVSLRLYEEVFDKPNHN